MNPTTAPTRYYVRFEDKRLIAAAKRKFGHAWRDYILCHDDILSVRDFDDLNDAQVFCAKITETYHYAYICERKYLKWDDELKRWECEVAIL